MGDQRVDEVEVFNAARRIESPQARAEYLALSCGNDDALLARVNRLLSEFDAQPSFLEHPPVDGPPIEMDCDTSQAGPADPRGTATVSQVDDFALDFLTHTDDPQALGRIKEYTVTEVIGRGGMGIVLKARDASLDRVVAIKVLAPELAGNAAARKRFLREAKTAAAVTHQHVVTIHAVGEDRLPYLVMECVSGQSLQDKLDQQGPLELREVLRIGAQVAAGLAGAHAHGVIHRDIKPANILLENGIERVRITDFGLARAIDDVTMTRTGEVAGTPQYMSPEQAQGQPIDARSDLFSFGSVLYAMCTGRPPFRAETTIDAIRRVCDDTPRPIREVNAEVPEWLTEIIDRLLAKRPEERFQTAQEVAQLLGKHLAHVQDPGSTPLPMVTPPSPLRGEGPGVRGKASRRWAAAAVVLCAVLAGLGVTEATGVTNLAGTVISIVTDKGTLIIEIDDPAVQVSLDGEELTISGGGVQQLRLRPGQYLFTATRDGRPVKQELVTITRGSERVVTVSRERIEQTITARQLSANTGAFVVLAAENAAERKFDTLVEAVHNSDPGDTIEIHGNGPFITEPIKINRTLVIRAGDGYRPVIQHQPTVVESPQPLFRTNVPLVLEGLELRFRQPTRQHGQAPHQTGVECSGAPIHVTNCRFLAEPDYSDTPFLGTTAIMAVYSPTWAVRNCDFVGGPTNTVSRSVVWWSPVSGRAVIENCLHTGSHCLSFSIQHANVRNVSVRLVHNTLAGAQPLGFVLWIVPNAFTKPADQPVEPVLRVTATGNIFQSRWKRVLQLQTTPSVSLQEAETLLRRLVSWEEARNLYARTDRLLYLSARTKADGPPVAEAYRLNSLEEWNEFWGLADTGSFGGLLSNRNASAFEASYPSQQVAVQRVPEDYRLLPDNPGYRAGPDGNDLGADVDLVGPGAAYERWKKTPEYQQWLKETGQKK